MSTYLSVFAAAALFAGAATASEPWTEIPTSSPPMMSGMTVADAGGDSAPVFGTGMRPYDALASAALTVVIATGDSYDVIPRAFMGERYDAPRAFASAARQPGGG